MGTRRRLTGDGREGILTCAHCLESPVRHHGRFTGERAGLGEAPAPRVHGRPARGQAGLDPGSFDSASQRPEGWFYSPTFSKCVLSTPGGKRVLSNHSGGPARSRPCLDKMRMVFFTCRLDICTNATHTHTHKKTVGNPWGPEHVTPNRMSWRQSCHYRSLVVVGGAGGC